MHELERQNTLQSHLESQLKELEEDTKLLTKKLTTYELSNKQLLDDNNQLIEHLKEVHKLYFILILYISYTYCYSYIIIIYYYRKKISINKV